MNLEVIKKQFADEGFANIYEWTDEPGTVYEKHHHRGKVSFYIVMGSIRMQFREENKTVYAGERFDVPVGVLHSAIVGDQGCQFIVGEEIEGDS